MSKRILVVDDEDLVTKSLKTLLKRQGYVVTIARCGKEAIEAVKTLDFDLVVADIRMPEMNGVETICNIRELLKQSNKSLIPEILITGYTDEANLKKAQELGVKDFIYKPFDIQTFLESIKKNTIS